MVLVEDGVVFVADADIPEEEARHYIARIKEIHPGYDRIEAHIDGEDIELTYTQTEAVPFERIRRITGYLVGTLDRFNDAKRAEESERVKHEI